MKSKKEEADYILNNYKVYESKKHAIKACFRTAHSDQIVQALILNKWLFSTPDGIIIISESLIRCTADLGFINVHRNINRKRKRDAETVIANTTTSYHPWFRLLCKVFSNAVLVPLNIEIRTSWRWLSNMLFICPWGALQNYTLIPARHLDIRCKEALAGMIHARGWTTTEYCNKSCTCIAGGFRYNKIAQQVFDTIGIPMLLTVFPLIVVSHALVYTSGILHFTKEEKEKEKTKRSFKVKQTTRGLRAMVSDMYDILRKDVHRARTERPQSKLTFAFKTDKVLNITEKICMTLIPQLVEATPIIVKKVNREDITKVHLKLLKNVLNNFSNELYS